MSLTVTIHRFPIIDVVSSGKLHRGEVRELMRTYRDLAHRGERMAILVDMRSFDAAGFDPNSRKLDAATYREGARDLRESIVCEARVVSSTITRYVLTAFDWLTGTPWPSATFTDAAEAERWVQRQLDRDIGHVARASA